MSPWPEQRDGPRSVFRKHIIASTGWRAEGGWICGNEWKGTCRKTQQFLKAQEADFSLYLVGLWRL